MQAARQLVPKNAQQVRIYGSEITPNGHVAVVFSYKQPMVERPEKWVYNLVYTEVVQKGPWYWKRESTRFGSFDLWVDNDYPIDYAVYEGDYIAVYRPIESGDVTAVEAKFKNGEDVRKEVQGGYFMIFSTEIVNVFSLRYYDKGGQLLEEREINICIFPL